VGFISEQGKVTVKRAFWTSTLFAVGILITIAAIGAITAAAGKMMGDLGCYGNYFVALIFFVVGLHLVGVIPFSFSGAGPVSMKRKGLLAAFILGLVFGIALGPCTFAYMAPMLAVTFKLAGEVPIYSAALLFAYGLGHCAAIVAAGTVHGTGAALPELERAIQRIDGRKSHLRHPRHARRRVAGFYRTMKTRASNQYHFVVPDISTVGFFPIGSNAGKVRNPQ